MIVETRIREFEKLGVGTFVHFGLYSLLGSGEWIEWNLNNRQVPVREYEELIHKFNPDPKWARRLVRLAKRAGSKYIVLTTRHHDGFSLYDTKGLSDFDSIHACGRDLVREFVDECNRQKIVPFFYHTLLDWHVEEYKTDFPKYLEYLRKSVDILLTSYGKIGGLWFDGMWDRSLKDPSADWEIEKLYSLIRSRQDCMIINNTGLNDRGKVGSEQIDSVTFERGKPFAVNPKDAKKYVASETCQTLCEHWGYAENDMRYRSLTDIIEDLCYCRSYGANYLLNVGPRSDGSVHPLEAETLKYLGRWMKINREAVYLPRPYARCGEKDFVLRRGKTLYLFCHDLPISSNPDVTLLSGDKCNVTFGTRLKIKSVEWLDSGEKLRFTQRLGVAGIRLIPYKYGNDLVVRVAKIVTE